MPQYSDDKPEGGEKREYGIVQAHRLNVAVRERIRRLDTILTDGLLEPVRGFAELKDKRAFTSAVPSKPLDEQRTDFIVAQEAYNRTVDDMRAAYSLGQGEAVQFLITQDLKRFMILDGTTDIEFMLAYEPTAKLLLIDYDLPNKKALPQYKAVECTHRRLGTLQYFPVSDKWLKTTYDSVLYQMTLLLIHRVFATDTAGHVYSTVFNGWVRSVDPGTGLDTHACILSVHVRRDEFMAFDLSRVDPKACFKNLKGVASTALVDLAPIRPIEIEQGRLTIHRSLRRCGLD